VNGTSAAVTVSGLTVYPVKSAIGVDLEEVELDGFGFRHDRRWMVVDEAGRFLTLRERARLAVISPALVGGRLRLEAEGVEAIELPLEPESGDAAAVTIWGAELEAVLAAGAVHEWVSTVLGSACRLAYMPATAGIPVDARYAGGGERIAFSDGFPILLISQESLDELNRRLAEPLPMNRFRPNLVVRGAGEPHAEDGWRRLRIGRTEFAVVKPCPRCVATTIEQGTGARGKEPLRTLAGYRSVDGKVYFGQNLIHGGPGRIRLGERVEVVG
jgi:uncharacterized protein